MAKITPDQLFPGYTSDGTTISFALADISELSTAEAAADTGNMGEVLRTLLGEVAMRYAALAPEAQDQYWTVTKNNPSIAPGGTGYLRETFSPRFDSEIVSKNLAEDA